MLRPPAALLLVATMLALLLFGGAVSGAPEAVRRQPSISTNFASAYLGAKVVEHSPGAKGAHNLLKEDASYMILPCSTERKVVTVQLAREMSVRSVVLVSLEYFASIVNRFVLLGAAEFPCTQPACRWTVLGHFSANFTRDPQTFEVAAPDGSLAPPVRYVRFLWVSEYGTEKSCTLTSLQIYGHDRFELGAIGIIGSADAADDTEEETAKHEPEPSSGHTAHNLTHPDAPNATLSGAYVPLSPYWRKPHRRGRPWNASWCPHTAEARDIERFFTRRELREQTCAANTTRPVPPSRALHDQVWSTIQRQIAGIRKNVSVLAANVSANATTRQQHRDLSKQVVKLRGDVSRLAQTVEALQAELETTRRWFAAAVAGSGAVVALIVVAFGFGAVARPTSPMHPTVVIRDVVNAVGQREGESSDTDPTAVVASAAGQLPGSTSMPEISELLESRDEASENRLGVS